MNANTRREILALISLATLIGVSGLTLREGVAAGDVSTALVRGALVPAAALWEFVRALGSPRETDVAARMMLIVGLAIWLG